MMKDQTRYKLQIGGRSLLPRAYGKDSRNVRKFKHGAGTTLASFFFALQKRVREEYKGVFSADAGGRIVAPEYTKFAKAWGWYKIIYDLAHGQIWNFDLVTSTPLTQALTLIQFTRDKNNAEKAQRKLDRQLAKSNNGNS